MSAPDPRGDAAALGEALEATAATADDAALGLVVRRYLPAILDALRSASAGDGRGSPVSRLSLGARVRKVRGSSWQGLVVGHYGTALNPDGVCVESEREPGSVQIYPVAALERVLDPPPPHDAAEGESAGRREP